MSLYNEITSILLTILNTKGDRKNRQPVLAMIKVIAVLYFSLNLSWAVEQERAVATQCWTYNGIHIYVHIDIGVLT